MSKAQPATTPAVAKRAAKQMYRGIVTTQAIADVFVRATSDAAANTAIKAGKGHRMKPRFSAWTLLQEAVAVDGYAPSTIPANEILRSGGLTEQELGKMYVQVLHNISVTRAAGIYTDSERQAMADAVGEFYDLLHQAIRAKSAQ
jgi:hypothetical protein